MTLQEKIEEFLREKDIITLEEIRDEIDTYGYDTPKNLEEAEALAFLAGCEFAWRGVLSILEAHGINPDGIDVTEEEKTQVLDALYKHKEEEE